MPNPFLSDAWIEEARAIRAKYDPESPDITTALKANLVVTDVPFGDGTVHAFLDTSSGKLALDTGKVDDPHATLTMDYGTARSFMVEQDQTALMQAFMSGKVKIAGDMTKLMALQTSAPSGELATRLAADMQAITE